MIKNEKLPGITTWPWLGKPMNAVRLATIKANNKR